MPLVGKTPWPRLTPGLLCRAFVCCAALGGYLFIIAAGGADMGRFLLFALCAAVYLIGPGLAFADWLGPRAPGLRAPLAMLYGIGFLAVVHCFAVRLGILWLLRALPAGITAVWAAAKLRAWLAAGRPRPAPPPVWANGVVLWALLCLLYAVMLSAQNPHPLAAGRVELNRDMLWNIGNVAALSRSFPAQDLRFAGVRFSYHYLTELLLAALHLVSGATVYDCNAFFAGPLFLAGELIALCSLGAHYFGPERRRAAHLTVYLLFGFQSLAMWQVSEKGDGIFANTLLKHIVTNINAQATALVLLCVFMVLFTVISRRGFAVGPRYLLALVAAFVLLCVAKGPQAAIVLCSLAITMAFVLVFQKPKDGRALLCLGGCAAAFAVLYTVLFAAGANQSMHFSIFSMQSSPAYQLLSPYTDRLCRAIPFISGYVWLVGIGAVNTFCMLPFQFLLWATGLPHALRHLPRLDPPCMLANGAVVGGFLAYHIFRHTSSSEIYFALVGMIFMTLLAADRLDGFLARKPLAPAKWPLWLAGAAAAVTTVCIVGACGRQAVAQLAVTVGAAPAQPNLRAVTAGDEAAMRWLDENGDAALVFTTDRTSAAPDFDNGISNVYTALSGRQAYMEGWTYAVTNMGVQEAVIRHRLDVNAAVFDPATDPEALRALCAAEGITCIVDDLAWPGSVSPALTPAFRNESVAVYLLSP